MTRNKVLLLAIAALLAGVLIYQTVNKSPAPVQPEPAPCPGPCPVPEPPRPRPRPWVNPSAAPGAPVEGGLVSPDGTEEMMCPLPASEKKKNVGGRDGAGLCVFTSIEYCARWSNERSLFDYQKCMRAEPGGGYPQKVDAMMKKYAPTARYIQCTKGDMGLLKKALESGRMVGVTYAGYDGHYSGKVAHMVSLVHCSDKWAAISDNNFIADNQHMWMSIGEFDRRWKDMQGGWPVILLRPAPTPPPRREVPTDSLRGCLNLRCRPFHEEIN